MALSAGPLSAPAAPVPATVPTVTATPGISQFAPPVHAAAQVHRAGGAAPPAHQEPVGQGAPAAEVEAGVQPQP